MRVTIPNRPTNPTHREVEWYDNLEHAKVLLEQMLNNADTANLPIVTMEIFLIGESWSPAFVAAVGYHIRLKDAVFGNHDLELTGPINTSSVQHPLGQTISHIRADEPANLLAAELVDEIRKHFAVIQTRTEGFGTQLQQLLQRQPA